MPRFRATSIKAPSMRTGPRSYQDVTNTPIPPHTMSPLTKSHDYAMHTLPVEILAAIFEAGQDTAITHGRKLPFAVLVSHVCAQWREIALGSPTLWKACAATSRPGSVVTVDLLRTCLERSRGCLLDIAVDLLAPSGGVDPDDEILRCLDVIMPHIHRWRRVTFNIEYEEAFAAMIWGLQNARAPMLEWLEIRLDDGTDPDDTVMRAAILLGGTPALAHLRLVGVGLPWCALQLTDSLTTLELPGARDDLIPGLLEFREMLLAVPLLRKLVLGYDPVGSTLEENQPVIELCSLEELVCTSVTWATIGLLSTPNLRALHLEDLVLADVRCFSAKLRESRCYPRLESLALHNVDVDCETTMSIIRTLPTVSRIKLVAGKRRNDYIVSTLLGLTKVHTISATVEPPPWPRLRTLAVAAASEGMLCDLAVARYEAALPLRTLQVPPELLHGDQESRGHWLRAYVHLEPCSAAPTPRGPVGDALGRQYEDEGSEDEHDSDEEAFGPEDDVGGN